MKTTIFKVWLDWTIPRPRDIPDELTDPVTVHVEGDELTLITCVITAMRVFPRVERIIMGAAAGYLAGIGKNASRDVRPVVRPPNSGMDGG